MIKIVLILSSCLMLLGREDLIKGIHRQQANPVNVKGLYYLPSDRRLA